jgi:hypothetical protein
VSDLHITLELLAAVERGEIPARVLTEVGWNHLMHLCPTCSAGFQSWQPRRHDTGVSYSSALRVLPLILERPRMRLRRPRGRRARICGRF